MNERKREELARDFALDPVQPLAREVLGLRPIELRRVGEGGPWRPEPDPLLSEEKIRSAIMVKNWERPSWDTTGMDLAAVWSRRSADRKHKVGAVILSNDSHVQVSAGLNGRHPGCKTEDRESDAVGASAFIHAEANALLRARWEHGEKHTIYVTHEPCFDCALLILAARHINRVVYAQPYEGDGRRRRGSEILREAGVEVVEWQG